MAVDYEYGNGHQRYRAKRREVYAELKEFAGPSPKIRAMLCFPAEDGSLYGVERSQSGSERESGSTKLSQSLALMAGARIVRIPRSVIQAVVEGARTCEVFDDAYSWCQELDSLATKEIVLVDEFVGDGKTVRAMESIARAKRLEIKATCTLLDFSPDTAEGRHSLYSWRAHSGTFIPGQRRSDESSVARS